MKRFVKTWMLWLLMLALPLQALASVVQLPCETAGHQRQPGGYAAKAGHKSYARQATRLKHDAKLVAKAPAKAAAKAMPESGHAACGPCAACCGAAAAVPNLQAVPALWEITDLHFASLPASHAGHIPDGLERPPRHHAA
jgi:hypothetical protein